ncbi:MAG: hypothetical protein GX938_09365, partial [Spirochaetales bacterium]|nr:hypothetical protein [Spirochaetales bacterium]
MKMHIDGATRRLLVFVLVLLVVGQVSLWAAEGAIKKALPQLTESEYQLLLDGEILHDVNDKILKYFVKGTEASQRALQAQNIEKGFVLGAVSYIPYTPAMKKMDASTRQLAIFNKIRQISTQEGLTYISWRAGNKEKLLIERSSYMADQKNLNNLLPDPVVNQLPKTAHSYVYQRDTSFGGNRYEHTYTNSEVEIFVEIQNISAMRVLGIFTAVKSGQLSINMGTYQLDEGLLLVALASVEGRDPQVSVLGLTVDLPSAFRRRIVALQGWLVNQLNT